MKSPVPHPTRTPPSTRSLPHYLGIVLMVVFWLFSGLAWASLDPITEAEDRRDPTAPALLEGLRSRSPLIRGRVAVAYGRIQQPASVDPLLRLAHDPAVAVRNKALYALGQLAWRPEFTEGRDAEIAAAVAEHLGERDPILRLTAIEAIGKIGLARTPDWLSPLLEHRSAKIRAETLLALFRYRYVSVKRHPDTPAPELPQALIERMRVLAADSHTEVRRNLIYGFARFKDARGLDIALKLTRDPDRWTRLFALNALIRIADPSALPAVTSRLKDRNAHVRWAAVHALEVLGQPGAAGRLRADRDRHVRSAVATVLGNAKTLPAEDSLVWLRQLAGDASAEVRAAAVVSLGQRLGDAAEAALAQALRDTHPLVRAAALVATRHLSQVQRARLLDQARPDTDPTVRSALLGGLATEPDPGAYAFIAEHTTAADSDIRQAAIMALAFRSEPSAVELCWQAYQANTGRHNTFLRESAATTMAAFAGAVSTQYLRAMLEDEVFTVGWVAYHALLQRGMTDIPQPIEKLTFSPFREMAIPPHPVVVITTARGVIRLRLNTAAAPVHVANFVGLVKSRVFDGKTWQRVVPNFVIQGGSPSTLGAVSQDFMLRAEVNPRRFQRGAVGMSRSELFNTGDSQLFITQVLAPHLDGQYTHFGEVIQGMTVVDRIEAGDRILTARIRD